MIDGEEVVARQLPLEVGTFAEIAEVVLCKGPHERVVAIVQACVGVVVRKIDTGMPVDDVDNDSEAVLMGDVHDLLKIRSLAEALVDPKITDRQITPIDRDADVGERHELDARHAEVAR